MAKLCFGNTSSTLSFTTLANICEIKRGASPRPIADPRWFSGNGTVGWVRISDITSSRKYLNTVSQFLSDEGVSHSVKLEENSLILSIAGSVGKPAITRIPICIHDGFVALKNPTVEVEYLYYFLEFSKDNWKNFTQSGSQPNLNGEIVGKLSIPIHPELEQKKIAEFFSALDERIGLQTQKISLLKEQKRGYQQRIFNQELGFTDDNGNAYPEWEEKKLGSLVKLGKAGGTPTASNKAFYNENADIPFLGISDMTEQGKYLSRTSKKITKEGLDSSSAWVVPAGHLIYAMYASVGKVGINKIPMATSQAMFSMMFKEHAAIEYVYYYLDFFRDNGLAKLITTGTQGNINAETLKCISIPLPSIPEQEKIADFFSALDKNIELNERKLGLLKEQKKGYLQGVFG